MFLSLSPPSFPSTLSKNQQKKMSSVRINQKKKKERERDNYFQMGKLRFRDSELPKYIETLEKRFERPHELQEPSRPPLSGTCWQGFLQTALTLGSWSHPYPPCLCIQSSPRRDLSRAAGGRDSDPGSISTLWASLSPSVTGGRAGEVTAGPACPERRLPEEGAAELLPQRSARVSQHSPADVNK
uniref:Uncharacterized protein n=1 Tax=Molossus molossus TaxID=27622 RepID=A0A7J8BYJ4_MOLMO|nr:hypothetical protein HJG59_010062 [Molossus molossus]